MNHPQAARTAFRSASPLQGASPVAGETPATAIAGVACFAAARLFGFDALPMTCDITSN